MSGGLRWSERRRQQIQRFRNKTNRAFGSCKCPDIDVGSTGCYLIMVTKFSASVTCSVGTGQESWERVTLTSTWTTLGQRRMWALPWATWGPGATPRGGDGALTSSTVTRCKYTHSTHHNPMRIVHFLPIILHRSTSTLANLALDQDVRSLSEVRSTQHSIIMIILSSSLLFYFSQMMCSISREIGCSWNDEIEHRQRRWTVGKLNVTLSKWKAQNYIYHFSPEIVKLRCDFQHKMLILINWGQQNNGNI